MNEELEAAALVEQDQNLSIDVFVLARLAVTLAFLSAAILISAPFLPALTWALVLAVVFIAPHRVLERFLPPSLAAGVSMLIVGLVIVGPLLLVIERLVSEAAAGVDYVQKTVQQGDWQTMLDAHPWLGRFQNWIARRFDLQATFSQLGAFVTNMTANFLRASTGQIITTLLAFYLLFFFLRDRAVALQTLARLSPFSNIETGRIIVRVRDTINAILFGTLAVSALQGLLGGLMFWVLDFNSPVLWGLIMGLVSIVPVLGSFVIWIPATIYLLIEDRWVEAIILGLWGGVVISSIDNLVRPLLIGDSMRLHTVPAFIAMLGGLQLFGPSGIVLGPIVMALSPLLLEFWRRRVGPDESS
ncbi:AI-2E family transporter [Methylocystis rosea]|uniref:AI-2E family transporter n=1 Tax=Methylocystis rosea TaxID=173366 RepID=A0ABX6EH31_9HYPH|nr:AI-2E family transporter [Methylocystis rosea]QGM93699.1 AI-2E family transporter [Methylocystis rosea]